LPKGRHHLALALLAFALSACAHQQPTAAASDRFSELYKKLHPSVAFITMQIPADDPKRKGKWDDAYGTGIVIASGAWGSRILTDAHVVADARNVRARFGDEGAAFPVYLVAKSNDDDDLALLDVDATWIPPMTFGDEAVIEPGHAIGVMGYPIPDAFEDEKLRNVVSLYTGRIASVRNGTIEIDVPIIPGESGGPVFDAESGNVIGLAESRFDDERAIGFATPLEVIRPFLEANDAGAQRSLHPHEVNTPGTHDRPAPAKR
jgi:S1-C subfamily serine protease